MLLHTFIFTSLFYLSSLVFVVGMVYKIRIYLTIPVPLKIPIPPVARSKWGVLLRMMKEIFLFSTLFKANKWTWLFGWLFHLGLVFELLRHLRFVYPAVLFFYQPIFDYGLWLIIIGASGLLLRRIVVDRVRYISAPSDYLWLVLFLMSAISGALMSMAVMPVNLSEVVQFMRGLIVFDMMEMPAHSVFISHFALALVVLFAYPASKLMHAPGILFSPTLNQIDDARSKRHIASTKPNQ